MKKLLVFLCVITTIFTFVSCNKQNNTSVVCEAAEYESFDFEAFIQEWSDVQINRDSESPLYSKNTASNSSPTLTIPVKQTEEYRFSHVRFNKNRYIYSYLPINATEKNYVLGTNFYIIIFDIDNSFSSVTEEFEVNNGYAYDKDINVWHINNNGKNITIYFPDGLIVSQEQISEYFTFETYTAGGGNDHVVS